jgi:hypothetical protein
VVAWGGQCAKPSTTSAANQRPSACAKPGYTANRCATACAKQAAANRSGARLRPTRDQGKDCNEDEYVSHDYHFHW